jgi:hypothetical protein
MNKINYLLKDVNLSDICLSKDGRRVNLSFINMSNGDLCFSLIASSVVVFNYHNNFDDDETLPTYIGEVTCEEVLQEEASLFLHKFGYNFIDNIGKILALRADHMFIIHIEGGFISTDIVCGQYELTPILRVNP